MANEKSIFKKIQCAECKKWKADPTGKAKGECCSRPMYLSDNWHVRLTRDGKTFVKSVSTRRKDAEELIHSIKDTIRQKKLLPWEEEPVTWAEAKEEFEKWYATTAPKTAAFYKTNMTNLEKVEIGQHKLKFTDLSLQDIEPKHLAAYRDERLKQVSPKTVHSEMGTVTRLYTLIMETRAVRKYPMLHAAHADLQKVKLPEVHNEKTRVLDQSAVETLLETIQAPHLKLITIIGVKTMLRKMNILGLRRSQIDFENHRLIIPRPLMKSKKKALPHVVPIDAELEGLLRAWIVEHKTFDYLFPSPTDPTTHIKSVAKGMERALKVMGINDGVTDRTERITFNVATRHTGATLAVDRTDDILSVSRILDHSNLAITQKKYVKKVDAKLAQVVNQVGATLKLAK